MTPVEIIALILIIAATIKMIVLLVSPNSWMNFSKFVLGGGFLTRVVGLILAAIVLYYLLTELTIIQILAAAVFIALLLVIGLASNMGVLVKKYEAQIRKRTLWKEHWLYTLIWIVLLVWGVIELFF
jgi:hypothetical protein